MTSFLHPETGRFDARLLAANVAKEPTELGRDFAGDLFEYRDGVYVRDANVLTKRCAESLGASYTKNMESQAAAHLLNIELAEVGLPDLPRGYLEYIVLENGIYWWRDATLEPHSPALGAMTKLPITHDAGAIPHSFIEWLGQVLGDDPDLHRHMWEVIGYLLMTGNPLQKIFMLYGEGGNGKGTMLRVIRRLLGRDNYSSISMHQLVDDRFATAGLYGKTANISGDLSSRFLSDPQVLKEITGGDSISASRKFGHSFEFVPYAVPIFASNEFFRTSDNSVGWRRRWEVIDFVQRVEGNGGFDEQLLFDDAAGIFNYAMEGLRTLMHRGKFQPPQAAQEATTRLHDAADPLLLWLDEDEAVDRGPELSSPSADVYKRYSGWSRRNGYSPMASGPFGLRLKQLGITRTRPREGVSRIVRYQGISVMLLPHED